MAEVLYNDAGTARTASFNVEINVEDWLYVHVVHEVTASSGTSPTLDIKYDIQTAAGNWAEVAAESQMTGGGQKITGFGPGAQTNRMLGHKLRLRHVIGGTSPSFTINTHVIGVDKGRV